jgi:hypothetical protein
MKKRTQILFATLASVALAAPGQLAASQDVGGYLYGTIETSSGNSYTGLLRWGREEAFWDDHFNASKQDEPATGRLPRGYKRSPRKVEVFGLEVSGPWERAWSQRQLIVRFGDLAEIRPRGDDRAELVFRNGESMRIDGGSNDLGGKITVWDATVGKIDVEWDRIRSIKFAATPASARPAGQRLSAKVRTTVGEFSGYLQWDKEEALTVDELDGEADDGDVSIAMGKIRSIERRSRRSSRVELVDGRVLELSGTNDVDSSIRGIVVDDARFGRVEIPWDVFERADLEVAKDSGKSYGDYAPLGEIRAKVTLRGGKTREGRIAYDLDETHLWEMLNGNQDDIDYDIPFARVKQIRPMGRRAEVTLDNGQKLRLEGQTDVGDEHAGIAFLDGAEEDYVTWDEIELVEIR